MHRLCCLRSPHSTTDPLPACAPRSRPAPPARPRREAYCTTGYSPVLAFDVEDLQATLVRCLQQGATMDGSIQHSSHGKVGGGRAGCISRFPLSMPPPILPPSTLAPRCCCCCCRWLRCVRPTV